MQLLAGKFGSEEDGVDDLRLTIRFRSHSQIAISFAEGPAEKQVKYGSIIFKINQIDLLHDALSTQNTYSGKGLIFLVLGPLAHCTHFFHLKKSSSAESWCFPIVFSYASKKPRPAHP